MYASLGIDSAEQSVAELGIKSTVVFTELGIMYEVIAEIKNNGASLPK